MTLRRRSEPDEIEEPGATKEVEEGHCPFCGQEKPDVKICPLCNNSGIVD